MVVAWGSGVATSTAVATDGAGAACPSAAAGAALSAPAEEPPATARVATARAGDARAARGAGAATAARAGGTRDDMLAFSQATAGSGPYGTAPIAAAAEQPATRHRRTPGLPARTARGALTPDTTRTAVAALRGEARCRIAARAPRTARRAATSLAAGTAMSAVRREQIREFSARPAGTTGNAYSTIGTGATVRRDEGEVVVQYRAVFA
jgi:hypothetical protein